MCRPSPISTGSIIYKSSIETVIVCVIFSLVHLYCRHVPGRLRVATHVVRLMYCILLYPSCTSYAWYTSNCSSTNHTQGYVSEYSTYLMYVPCGIIATVVILIRIFFVCIQGTYVHVCILMVGKIHDYSTIRNIVYVHIY